MTLLHRAAQFNAAGCSRVLLYRGADPFMLVPAIEWTPLHCAAQRNAPALVKAFLDYKVDLAAVDSSGRNALHVASIHGALEFVAELIHSKAFALNEPNLSVDSRVSFRLWFFWQK